MTERTATVRAHPNIALAKYWGKRPVPGNVPATPSMSITLEGLNTETTVSFDPDLIEDSFELDGVMRRGATLARVVALLDDVRSASGVPMRARVVSRNDFPTASGLASSASGFAALAGAASAALGLSVDNQALSRMARRASASAARSIFGGFVSLGTEDDPAAVQLAGKDYWDIAVVVATVSEAAKEVSSRSGMEHCRETSPYYRSWVDDAGRLHQELCDALRNRDLPKLGFGAEVSALRMHACMMASSPPLLYWTAATMEVLREVVASRGSGLSAWATIDAGPHVKILCPMSEAVTIAERVKPLCRRTIIARPGDGITLMSGGLTQDSA